MSDETKIYCGQCGNESRDVYQGVFVENEWVMCDRCTTATPLIEVVEKTTMWDSYKKRAN